jgi:hypothetical protein
MQVPIGSLPPPPEIFLLLSIAIGPILGLGRFLTLGSVGTAECTVIVG